MNAILQRLGKFSEQDLNRLGEAIAAEIRRRESAGPPAPAVPDIEELRALERTTKGRCRIACDCMRGARAKKSANSRRVA